MKRYEGELKIIFGSLGFAFIPVFVLTGAELTVQSLLFGRLIVAVLFLYYLLENRNSIFNFTRKRFILLTIWALVMLGSMACYFFSISLSGMGISAAILGTQPLFIVFLAMLFLKEKISWITWISCLLCLMGIVLVSGVDSFSFSDYFFGVILAIGSSLLSAINFIFKKMHFPDFSGKQSVFYQSLFQMPFLIPFIILEPGILSVESFLSVIGLGLICSVFAYVLIYDGISQVKGQQIGILQSVEYVMPVFIGVYLFNEKITILPAVGIGLIIISCAMITLFSPKKE